MYKSLVTLSQEELSIVKIEGSSLTIPGLAPSLIDIISAAVDGEPLPHYMGAPLFDKNEEEGNVRVSISELDSSALEQIVQAGDDQDNADNSQRTPASNEQSEADKEGAD